MKLKIRPLKAGRGFITYLPKALVINELFKLGDAFEIEFDAKKIRKVKISSAKGPIIYPGYYNAYSGYNTSSVSVHNSFDRGLS